MKILILSVLVVLFLAFSAYIVRELKNTAPGAELDTSKITRISFLITFILTNIVLVVKLL